MSWPELDWLREAEVLAPLDVHFARTLARLAGDARPEVLLAAALASRAVQQGHVCLDLARWAGRPVAGGPDGLPVVDADGRARGDLAWPDLAAWRAALETSPLVGLAAGGDGGRGVASERGNASGHDVAGARGVAVDGGERGAAPLVLDGAGRLYLRRYWDHEGALAAALRDRAAGTAADVDRVVLAEGLARLFGSGGARGDAPVDAAAGIDAGGRVDVVSAPGAAGQQAAADAAVTRRLCVVTGGPGTGKTTTVVKILALLAEQAQALGVPPPRVALVAPTGKAAARLTEAVRRARAGLDVADAVRTAIPDAAATIHRTLGSLPGVATRFRFDAGNPLAEDVVLVDEASMVDVALMRRLVDAVRPPARLILLGDKDQLSSVEAGAVLGDLCAAPALRGCVVELTHSFRFGPESGIGALARAVNAGDAGAALEILTGDRHPDVTLVEPSAAARGRAVVDPALARCVVDGYRPYLAAVAGLAPLSAAAAAGRAPRADAGAEGGDGDEGFAAAELACLAAFDGFRVLAAHRRGPGGVEQLNPAIARLLEDAGLLAPAARLALGQPVIVTRNDYNVMLFNGDIGLVLPDPARPGRRRVVFAAPDGRARALAPARLPAHAMAFALSVHKAQGSEFDAVAVVLPEADSPILSRELLYTAVTRARRSVTVFGSAALVRAAIERRIERASGLAGRLG